MTDELLVAQAEWLPNYKSAEIEAARARLARHERQGTRVMLSASAGAARLQTRTVEELAADKLAQETARTSDKG
jgi:alpha-galactosidase